MSRVRARTLWLRGTRVEGTPWASSWLEPRNADAFASGKGHVEVWYQKHPRGGTLQIELSEHHERLETRSAKTKDAWATTPLEPEAASVKLKALFGGNYIRRVAKGNLDRAALAEELGEAIALYRSGRPQKSCLVVGSTDHAKSRGTPVSP